LKLDPDQTLARYLSECAILADPEKQEIAPARRLAVRKLPVAVPVLGLLVVALVVGGGIYAVTESNSNGKAPGVARAGSKGAPVGLTPANPDPSAVPVAPPLPIVAIKAAHIEVRGADGTKFLSRTFAPGESYSPHASAPAGR